jgi:hypothetical protein
VSSQDNNNNNNPEDAEIEQHDDFFFPQTGKIRNLIAPLLVLHRPKGRDGTLQQEEGR